MLPNQLVEIRGDIERESIDVIDAVVQATPGASRIGIVRQIVRDWAAREVHKSTLVCRVTNSNGGAPLSSSGHHGTEVES